MPPYQTPFAAGDHINGQFELLRPLGVGGLGDVWDAQRVGSNVRVALKILQPQFKHSFEHTARLQRERAILEAIRDISVVQCFGGGGLTLWQRSGQTVELGDARGLPFLELALVEGETLGRKLARTRASGESRFARAIALRDAVALFQPLLRALGELHAKGIVHRDLKPGNIVIGPKRRATLLDWNLGKVPDNQMGLTTLAHRSCGSRPYCCPAQFEQLLSAGPRADIYSMAAVMVEALTGFQFKNFCDENHLPDLTRLRQTLLYGRELERSGSTVPERGSVAPAPVGRGPQIPSVLTDVLLQSLSSEPEARPESMEALRQSLLIAERGTQSRTVALSQLAGNDDDEPTRVQRDSHPSLGQPRPTLAADQHTLFGQVEAEASVPSLAPTLGTPPLALAPEEGWQAEWRRWALAIAFGSALTLALTRLF